MYVVCQTYCLMAIWWATLAATVYLSAGSAVATEPTASETEVQPSDAEQEPPRLPAPPNAKAMPEPNRVWIDGKQRVVYVDGYVSLNEGLLEMFACPTGTKEHESVVAVYSSAQVVHAALLAVGAKVGHPVRWEPKFEPPAGTEITVEVRWQDANGKWLKISAQQWLRDVDTRKVMTHPWVFAGSGFWTDEETKERYYLAEGGDLICVSNFSSATLDIPVQSSQANDGLLFEANTKKIPPVGTPVRLVLRPKLDEKKK